jgi:hypothetical protein
VKVTSIVPMVLLSMCLNPAWGNEDPLKLRYGQDFLYDMPNEPAVILELTPAPKASKSSQVIGQLGQAKIIPAFSSIKSKTP